MISANTLFHFTKSLDNIKNILTNNFSPRYCLERLDFLSNKELNFAIPMVCFCDIPLSQITDHVNTYGTYAIGLKKEWAIINAISPVIYLHNDSRTSNAINKLFESAAKWDKVEIILKNNLTATSTKNFIELLCYCKIHKGKMWRNNELIHNITFYNEREWRYVPKIDELEAINSKIFISKEEFDDEARRTIFNNLLTDFKIQFTPMDIKYIIINKEKERIKMVQMIEEIKGNIYSLSELKELSSKIISVEQIKDDF